jgi:dTDP-4-dehydrorhamnose 3,5-epimerase
MIFTETILKGSYEITLTPHGDSRGWFARTYCKKEFEQIGHQQEWVQLNHSFSSQKGTVRGMHFQHAPFAEIKMLRCIAGSVYDVIIDLRKDSPTFLKWVGTELSAQNKKMLYIPAGFAHGFQTLTDDVELVYHHTEFYTPAAEAGIRYNDSAINIEWPLGVSEISERDTNHPLIDSTFKGL